VIKSTLSQFLLASERASKASKTLLGVTNGNRIDIYVVRKTSL